MVATRFLVTASVLVASVAIALVGVGRPAPRRHPLDSLREALMATEDARGDATPLLLAVRHHDLDVRRRAVMALGRFEREGHITTIRRALADRSPIVRAEAANAVAQAAYQRGAAAAFAALEPRVREEPVPMVVGALARALGRLRYETVEEMAAAEAEVLACLSRGTSLAAGDAALLAPVHLGVALGLDSLSRRARVRPLSADAVRVLRELVGADVSSRPETTETVRRTRVAAASALGTASGFDGERVDAAVASRDPQLRRLGAQAAVRDAATPPAVIERLRHDPSPLVRVELARAIAQPSAAACELVALLTTDAHVHVRLVALDATAKACVGVPQAPRVARELGRLAADAAADWRVRARALTAWARLDGSAARAIVSQAASASQWQERMYAARAATTLRDVTTLDRLAGDDKANVREAALTGLVTIEAPSVERTAVAALTSDDYQLLRTAATALAKARERRTVADALLAALARVSQHGRDTARDPRQAMLETLREVGSVEDSARVEPYTTDADPVIAALAASILTTWTGHAVVAAPRPRADQRRVPPIEDVRRLARGSATMRLAGLGDIEFRLLAFDAPTNVARFVEQARAGFFSGLTWHRVEPNFVLQGGSPGANEYSAQGAYTNDEITSASHVRGTIGISTRGRDTGDGQLFINLADNIRLDHNFTIIGEVVRGFEVMDAVVEGTTIEAVDVRIDP